MSRLDAEDYNDPREWFRTINPPLFNRAKIQKRIDKIVGLSERGQSIILLRWAWESSYEMYGQLKQRYNFLTLEKEGQTIEFSVPRWVIEQRIEPEQFRPSWDATRYTLDPSTVVTDTSTARYDLNGDLVYAGDVIYAGDKLDKGPCPREWFQNLWVIAEHDAQCCAKAKEMGRSCWGYYRHPSEWDINEVRRIHHAKLNDPNYNQSPFEELTAETLEQSAKSEFEYKEKVHAEQKAELDLRIDDFFRLHQHRLTTDDPKVLSDGKYHFLGNGFQKTEAGVIVRAGE